VVDDVDINLYVAEGILSSYEIAVEMVESGQEAVDRIKNGEEFDIIFMDHMMPGMNGVEATKIMRGLGYTLPIVALTANALKDAAKMFMSNGFSGFISKPIDIEKLNIYLERFIRDKHAAKMEAGENANDDVNVDVSIKKNQAPANKNLQKPDRLDATA